MTPDKGDPQPTNDQGPTPTHHQDAGKSHVGMALLATHRNLNVFPIYPTRDGVCICSDGEACQNSGRHPLIDGGIGEATND